MDDQASSRLILLRHAKSDWPDGMDDRDRPLAARGVADATAAGPLLAGIGRSDVVLCSPARRTRQTWRLVASGLTDPPAAQFEEVLYGASVPELLDLVRSLPDDAGTVLVIGHEPTMSSTAKVLAGPDSSTADLARLEAKYPTCGVAIFSRDGGWAGLGAEGATLDRFVVPRGDQT